MQYLPLIKALRGQGAMLEVGDMTRQSIEVVHGMIWDVFFQDSLLLLIIYKDEAVEQARPEPPPGQPVPPKTFRTVREFTFKWIRVANVVADSQRRQIFSWSARPGLCSRASTRRCIQTLIYVQKQRRLARGQQQHLPQDRE